MPLSELEFAEVWIVEDGFWVELDRRGWRVDDAGAPGRRPRLVIVAELVQHSLVDEEGVYHGEWQLRHPGGVVLLDEPASPMPMAGAARRCAEYPDVLVVDAELLEIALREVLDEDEACDATGIVLRAGWRPGASA